MIGVMFKKPQFYLSYASTLMLSTYLPYEQYYSPCPLRAQKTATPNFDVAARGGGRSDDDANAQIL